MYNTITFLFTKFYLLEYNNCSEFDERYYYSVVYPGGQRGCNPTWKMLNYSKIFINESFLD